MNLQSFFNMEKLCGYTKLFSIWKKTLAAFEGVAHRRRHNIVFRERLVPGRTLAGGRMAAPKTYLGTVGSTSRSLSGALRTRV